MPESTGVPSWVTLTSDERVVWSGHPSIRQVGWLIVVSAIAIGIGCVGLVLLEDILRLLALIPLALGLLLFARTYIYHRSIQYVLTTEEVYKKTGLLSRDVMNIRLDRIQNTAFTQSFFERILSYGTIEIDTAGTGGTELILHAVPRPEHVNGLLTEQLDAISPKPQDQPA
jgi:uncharacterized membrane protein YdbT with pleckstrin-like domain